jgi:hypothetical protein
VGHLARHDHDHRNRAAPGCGSRRSSATGGSRRTSDIRSNGTDTDTGNGTDTGSASAARPASFLGYRLKNKVSKILLSKALILNGLVLFRFYDPISWVSWYNRDSIAATAARR